MLTTGHLWIVHILGYDRDELTSRVIVDDSRVVVCKSCHKAPAEAGIGCEKKEASK